MGRMHAHVLFAVYCNLIGEYWIGKDFGIIVSEKATELFIA